MEELRKQIDILINKAEESKYSHMFHGLTSDAREDEGQIQAFKLIKLLIDTNLKLSN